MKIRTVDEDKRLLELCDEMIDLFENNEEWYMLMSVLRTYHLLKLEWRYFTPGKNRYGEWGEEPQPNSKSLKKPKLKIVKRHKE